MLAKTMYRISKTWQPLEQSLIQLYGKAWPLVRNYLVL